jgi:quinol monooxygenase YgiN
VQLAANNIKHERKPEAMSQSTNVVSIHPYFKVHPGKLEEFKAALPAFVAKTAAEKKNLYYDFTIDGDVVFCREAYDGAEALLEHLESVGALVAEALKISDVIRLEIHGPAAELEKLKGPLANMKPAWFTYVCGVKR